LTHRYHRDHRCGIIISCVLCTQTIISALSKYIYSQETVKSRGFLRTTVHELFARVLRIWYVFSLQKPFLAGAQFIIISYEREEKKLSKQSALCVQVHGVVVICYYLSFFTATGIALFALSIFIILFLIPVKTYVIIISCQ